MTWENTKKGIDQLNQERLKDLHRMVIFELGLEASVHERVKE